MMSTPKMPYPHLLTKELLEDFRSDVFSMGLIMFRMLSGRLPEWPFEWPPPGFGRLRGRVHPRLVQLLRKAIEVDPRRRYADAEQMQSAFRRV